jgi:hypothetical protein
VPFVGDDQYWREIGEVVKLQQLTARTQEVAIRPASDPTRVMSDR